MWLVSVIVPAAAATAASHPADLLTGLLNGDPNKLKFASAQDAAKQLISTRGWKGFAIASPLRFAAAIQFFHNIRPRRWDLPSVSGRPEDI